MSSFNLIFSCALRAETRVLRRQSWLAWRSSSGWSVIPWKEFVKIDSDQRSKCDTDKDSNDPIRGAALLEPTTYRASRQIHWFHSMEMLGLHVATIGEGHWTSLEGILCRPGGTGPTNLRFSNCLGHSHRKWDARMLTHWIETWKRQFEGGEINRRRRKTRQRHIWRRISVNDNKASDQSPVTSPAECHGLSAELVKSSGTSRNYRGAISYSSRRTLAPGPIQRFF